MNFQEGKAVRELGNKKNGHFTRTYKQYLKLQLKCTRRALKLLDYLMKLIYL